MVMQQNVRAECPRCGRQLENFNGHIGYCSQHKWVSPAGLGFEAEAAEQNRLDAEALEASRLEAERQKQEELARQKQEEHAQAVRKTIFAIAAVLLVIAGVTFFVIRPSLNYSSAGKKFDAGEYEEARDEYNALGTYKDSAARAELCNALLSLQNGDTEAAAAKLDLLTGDENKELAAKLGSALIPVMNDWKNKGLTPELLLSLLQKSAVIDPKGSLDLAKLTLEGHAALLDGEQLSFIAWDVTDDGNPELVTLNPDYSVTVYRMSADSNLLIPVDEPVQAECLLEFGNEYKENDISLAASCYEEAYQMDPNDVSRSSVEEATRTILKEWKTRGIEPAQIPARIRFADEEKFDLSDIDREKAYEEAAAAAAGDPVQFEFTDWDGDGYKELLAIYSDGKLVLFGIDGSWKALSTVETNLSGASYTIAEEKTPLILAGSGAKDELLALTGTGNKLSELFREEGINHLEIKAVPVTFSRKLAGSIVRNEDYSYDAEGTANRPVRIGIDWQKDNYPLPESAAASVLRYFESRCYDIPEETALLIADPETDLTFSAEMLAELPAPTDLDKLSVASYRTEDDIEYFEVSYPAGTRNVRTWTTAENHKGWKTAGAAETYAEGQSVADIDFSIPLLSLNAETNSSLSTKGSRATYRVMVPGAGRVGLTWQSGKAAANGTSHVVTMTRGSLNGEEVFSYALKPSTNIQMTTDLFTAAGVYYVTVEAKAADTAPYAITIRYKPDPYVEKESNDTYQTATAIELNTTYSGNISGASDTDWYSFILDEPAAVNISFGSSGAGRGSSSSHTAALYSGTEGSVQTTVTVPGNAQLTESGVLYLSAGTYLVQVSKGSSLATDEYTLTINTLQAEGTSEFEPNDAAESANRIPVNEDVRAAIGKEGDVDFFRFTLENDAVVQPHFSFRPTDSSSKTYVLTVSGENRQELLKVNIGGKESAKVIAPLALPAGSYIVKVENPRFIRQDYTLRIVSEEVGSAEKEVNDSLGLANALPFGTTVTGVISAETDIDYYKLDFSDTMTVTLKFAFPPTTVTGTAYVMTIEQNGKTQWTANIKGDSGGMEQQLQFPAGEYYIRIKPSAWIGAVYTIEVK